MTEISSIEEPVEISEFPPVEPSSNSFLRSIGYPRLDTIGTYPWWLLGVGGILVGGGLFCIRKRLCKTGQIDGVELNGDFEEIGNPAEDSKAQPSESSPLRRESLASDSQIPLSPRNASFSAPSAIPTRWANKDQSPPQTPKPNSRQPHDPPPSLISKRPSTLTTETIPPALPLHHAEPIPPKINQTALQSPLFCSEEDQAKIATVIKILDEKTMLGVVGETGTLLRIKKEILHVHSLAFLWTIFNNPDLKRRMPNIFNKHTFLAGYFHKKGFMSGLNEGMQRYSPRELAPYLDDWAKSLNTTKAAVQPLIEAPFNDRSHNWEALALHLISV